MFIHALTWRPLEGIQGLCGNKMLIKQKQWGQGPEPRRLPEAEGTGQKEGLPRDPGRQKRSGTALCSDVSEVCQEARGRTVTQERPRTCGLWMCMGLACDRDQGFLRFPSLPLHGFYKVISSVK